MSRRSYVLQRYVIKISLHEGTNMKYYIIINIRQPRLHTVDHLILQDVPLARFAVTNRMHVWFSSYLTCPGEHKSSAHGHFWDSDTCGVLQSSVVGSQQFTEDIEELIQTFNVKNHFCADDSRVLAHMRLCQIRCHKSNIECVVLRIQDRCSEKRLQLNPDKTEVISFGSRAHLKKFNAINLNVSSEYQAIVRRPRSRCLAG